MNPCVVLSDMSSPLDKHNTTINTKSYDQMSVQRYRLLMFDLNVINCYFRISEVVFVLVCIIYIYIYICLSNQLKIGWVRPECMVVGSLHGIDSQMVMSFVFFLLHFIVTRCTRNHIMWKKEAAFNKNLSLD